MLNTYSLQSVLLSIDNLKTLGVTAVTINLSYPALLPEFYGSTDEYNSYVNVYTSLANQIRSRGLKLIIKSTEMLQAGSGSTKYTIPNFYNTVTTYDQYIGGRIRVAQTIATLIRPDYMVVMTEPDVEAGQSNQPVNTLDNAASLVSQVSAAVKLVAPTIQVGAGMGTWSPMYNTLADRIASMSTIDFVDMHIYPGSNGFLNRAAEIADIAASHGKSASVSETWIYKVTSAELSASQANPSAFFSFASRRNFFACMAPLDGQYMQTIVKFANWKNLKFLSPSYTLFFHSYLNYSQYVYASNAALNYAESSAAYPAMQSGVFTASGTAYGNAIR